MDILDRIVAEKRLEVAQLPAKHVCASDLQAAMQARDDRRDFLDPLKSPKAGPIALIAEVKKASPSAGVICPDFDPVRIAKMYETAGASCLSVLTDQKFFQGSLDYLLQIRQAVRLPLLRKDFIIEARQILESIQAGADAILLIASILNDAELKHFHSMAQESGLSALVEVHDEAELDRALAVGASLIGINNRDLKTFRVDLATTERLAARLRSTCPGTTLPFLVGESGIHSSADVKRLIAAGAGAMLVGESLMRDANPQAKVRELLGN